MEPKLSDSFFNLCLQTENTFEYWMETAKKIKKEFPDRILITSICCQDNKEDWQFMVKSCLEAGSDGFELALSCPNGAHGDKGSVDLDNPTVGVSVGRVPSAIKRITEYVVEVAQGKPVYPKLTPNITDIIPIARGALQGKASGISTINTDAGIPGFFPDSYPFPQIGTKKVVMSGGVSGDCIRPIALRCISKIHNTFPSLSIFGIGGIWNSYHALQHLYAGASVVEMCSAIQRYSFEIAHELISGLQFYLYPWSRPDLTALLSQHIGTKNMPHKNLPAEGPTGKIPTLAEIRGLGAKKVVEREDIEQTWAVVAKINEEQCIGCGKCSLACRDNSVEAIAVDANGKWKVNDEKCLGCGLCSSVCPMSAIDYVRIKDKEWHHQP